jgi:hypothetical protein
MKSSSRFQSIARSNPVARRTAQFAAGMPAFSYIRIARYCRRRSLKSSMSAVVPGLEAGPFFLVFSASTLPVYAPKAA